MNIKKLFILLACICTIQTVSALKVTITNNFKEKMWFGFETVGKSKGRARAQSVSGGVAHGETKPFDLGDTHIEAVTAFHTHKMEIFIKIGLPKIKLPNASIEHWHLELTPDGKLREIKE